MSALPKCPLIVSLFRLKNLLLISMVLPLFFGIVPAESAVLSLEQCIDLALQNNPDMKKQRLGLESAEEDIFDQKSQNLGTFNVVSSYAHYNLPRTLAPLTPSAVISNPASVPTTEDLYTVGLVYEVALFTGFAQTRMIEIVSLQKEMADASLNLSREQLIYNIKTIYISTLSLESQKEAQASYVEALQYLYDDMVRQVQLGKKARVAQLKAAADLQKAQAEASQISANITIMKASLANLIGLRELPELQAIDFSVAPEAVIQDDFTDQLDDLERLRVGRLSIDRNAKLVEKAKAALYPQIVLNAAYGQNLGFRDNHDPDGSDWENQEVWQAGLNLQWNIFDFGGNQARVRKARMAERQSQCEQTKTEFELKRALREATANINAAVSNYTTSKAELTMTKEVEIIEQVRFEQGVIDISDLLDAKARNRLAESHHIDAAYRYQKACFYLDYLLEKGVHQ